MRILSSLTYYTPHISGLTLYARHITAGLVARGHSLTVMTSRYDRSLPREERIDGARVVRNRVWARLSKGVLMPGYFYRTCRELHRHDVLFLNLPQIEGCAVALYARLLRKPVVTTYHCDLELPPGAARMVFTPLIKLSHLLTVLLSHRVIVNTEDYVTNSRFLRHFRGRIEVSYPPCVMPAADDDAAPLGLPAEGPVIGFVGRFAEEKGIAYILEAAPAVLKEFPAAVFAFVGEREKTFGEQVYERLRDRIEALGDHVRLLGVVPEAQLAEFYRRCDVLLLPSINSTESFGMVQVEAMFSGTPVVATDIAGVREPVRVTGMGKLVPPRDGAAIAQAVVELLRDAGSHRRTPEELDALFGVRRAVDHYESLMERLSAPRRARAEARVSSQTQDRR